VPIGYITLSQACPGKYLSKYLHVCAYLLPTGLPPKVLLLQVQRVRGVYLATALANWKGSLST
jgi:hypothetical protein